METKVILKSSLLSGYLLAMLFASGQNSYFTAGVNIGTISTEAAYSVSYAQHRSLVAAQEIDSNTVQTGGRNGEPRTGLNISSLISSGLYNNANGYSVDNWDSQNNISSFNGNGLRITSTGNAYSQDAI